MLHIFLDVMPTPKSRARVTKSGHAYTPASTKKAQQDIQLLLKSYMNRNQILTTPKPVFVKMIFNYPIPRKITDSDKLLGDLGMFYKSSRPDLDNLAKLVADAMNGIVYFDDSQIVKLLCEKKYSIQEGIDLNIVEI